MKRLIGFEIGSYSFDADPGTLTLSGIGTIDMEQILLITNVIDGIIIYNFADPNKTGTFVPGTGVLTFAYDTTSMDDGDLLQIYVDIGSNGYDFSLDINKTIDQAPISAQYTSPELLHTILDTEVTDGAWDYAGTHDIGSVIDMRGYTELLVYLVIDIGDAVDIQCRALGQTEAAGGATDEYAFAIETVSSTDIKVDLEYIELNDDSDQNIILRIETRGVPYIQFQMRNTTNEATTVGTVKINKIWR